MAEQERLNRTARVRATQASADAFVQASLSTGLSAATPTGMLIKQVMVDLPGVTALSALGADFGLEFTITRSTKSAIPNLSDSDCLMRYGIAGLLTTSGLAILPCTFFFPQESGQLIVQDTLYFQFDSNGVGSALSCDFLIDYEFVSLKEIEFLRLLAAQP